MNYPIKYAVLELKVDGGILHDYEDITKGFIVSKCHVLIENLTYASNGRSYPKYIVSFPYDNFSYFDIWFARNKDNYRSYISDLYKRYYEERKNPSREYLRDGYPLHVVGELFNTYEEAKELADSKNSRLKDEILTNTGRAAYEKLKKEFEDTMEVCGEYEKYIFANTTDMEVSLLASEYEDAFNRMIRENLLKEFISDPDKLQEALAKYDQTKNIIKI